MLSVNRPASGGTLMSFGGEGNLFQRSWKTGIWNDRNFFFSPLVGILEELL